MTNETNAADVLQAIEESTVTVQRGMGSMDVTPGELQDTDLINVEDMQVTVAMAREMGLLNQPQDDESLSVGAAARAATDATDTKPTREAIGHEGFDQTAAALDKRVAEGTMDRAEATAYENAVAAVALQGLTITEVTETLDGLADGSMSELDVDKNTIQIVNSVEDQVTAASTEAAVSELGQIGFDRLQQLATASPAVNSAIRQFAIERALGSADHSWSEFLALCEDEVS